LYDKKVENSKIGYIDGQVRGNCGTV